MYNKRDTSFLMYISVSFYLTEMFCHEDPHDQKYATFASWGRKSPEIKAHISLNLMEKTVINQ
jgi:hypothetical protein